MYSIAIIAAAASMQNIMQMDEQARQYANITYLPYTSIDHLVYVYEQNLNRFDALLFGGSYTYTVLKERLGSISSPCAFFSVTDRDYYRMLARLAVQQPGLDFSRVLIDKPECPVNFESVFGRPGLPMIDLNDDPAVNYGDYWAVALEAYRSYWKSGAVDLIITRFGSMEPALQQAGIRCEFLLPSRESMLDTFLGLMTQLDAANHQDSSACLGIISPKTPLPARSRDRFYRVIAQCNQRLGDVFLIYHRGDAVEITTTAAVLQELSQRYTLCPLLFSLENQLEFPVAVGWGCAGDVVTAHKNARRALKAASRSSSSASYLVTAESYIIGPLGSESPSQIPSARTAPRDELSLPEETLKKIAALAARSPSSMISAAELAPALGLTTRSAARILLRLEASGQAVPAKQQNAPGRGRPVKYYRIRL